MEADKPESPGTAPAGVPGPVAACAPDPDAPGSVAPGSAAAPAADAAAPVAGAPVAGAPDLPDPDPDFDPEIEALLPAEPSSPTQGQSQGQAQGAPQKRGLIARRGAEWALVVLLFVLLGVAFVVSFALGKYALTLDDTLQIIGHYLFGTTGTYASSSETVFVQVRLPRLVTCVCAGAALAVSGAVYQGIFKNPMVSPDLLGASSGSAFGACVGILLGSSYTQIHISAFLVGLLAVGLTMSVSAAVSRGQNNTITMILTGMVVTALFNAGVSIAKTLANPDTQLGEITFWLMGSMTHMSTANLPILIVPVLIGLVPIILLRYRLNVLSFGDEEAKTLGLNVTALRLVFIVCSTLVTSATVACCGMVGWIGLVIPHLLRIVLGPDYRLLIPASIAGGALFLLLVDNITRIFFQVEISIGILTALVGAPFFLVLLLKGRKGWV